MIYIQLFLSFLQIGLFSVGGGYAAIPLVQSLIVERQGWITMTEFTNLITIAEMTPGPIAVNSATIINLLSHVCRNSDSGTSGSGCGNLGMYFPILYHCIGIGIHISALPWRLCDGKYFRQSSPSGSGADRRCRTFDATGSSSSRGKWGKDDPVGQSGSFFGSFYSAP
jgi:hypothetical protein